MHVKHVRRVQSFLFSFSITNFPPYRHMWPRQGTHVQIEIFFVQAKGAYLYDIFRKVFSYEIMFGILQPLNRFIHILSDALIKKKKKPNDESLCSCQYEYNIFFL
jgi:hypothetical protein